MIASSSIIAKEHIALYFYGDMTEVYQLSQWLEPLYELHKNENIVLVVRKKIVAKYLEENTKFIVYYAGSIDDLLSFYERSSFKVILYVNNGAKNFQSLIYHRAIHIHLNHGESEKSSMHSNQCKAYDYTFVVADAAIDRYKRHIINIKRANYIKIGRPQLDFVSSNIKKPAKTVILYAPTDESTHISMKYTSLDRLGVKIVDSILKNDNYFLIYRPHPSTGAHSKEIRKINKEIIKKVNSADNARLETEMSAIDLLSITDLAIFDNSSLIIDFLYFNRPMFATDMFISKYHNKNNFKMLEGCIMLDESNVDNLANMIEYELNNDSWKEKREEIKKYYLGDYKKNESTNIFIDEVLNAMKERDELLEKKGMLNTIH